MVVATLSLSENLPDKDLLPTTGNTRFVLENGNGNIHYH
jgi:hypothetical protein